MQIEGFEAGSSAPEKMERDRENLFAIPLSANSPKFRKALKTSLRYVPLRVGLEMIGPVLLSKNLCEMWIIHVRGGKLGYEDILDRHIQL